MEHPVGRTLRVFLVLVSAAGFYRLTVVPLIEPRNHAVSVALEPTPEEAAAIRDRIDGKVEAIGEIFPPGSWEREKPIVLENRQMRLLFKQYNNMPDGRVNLVPCTLVILPEPKQEGGGAAGGRTIVMRAPQGAMLQFSEPFDLRQGRLSQSMPVGGSLGGQVTIRGSATTEGGEDDFEIITRDVEMIGTEVRSNEPVQFRYGRSSGSGRAVLVKLLAKQPEPGKPAESGQGGLAGVEFVRLERDVQLKLDGLGGGLLPGSRPDAAAVEAPATVTCRGGLTVHMAGNLITLEDHVDVVRPLADGGSEQLACDLLSIAVADQEKGGLQAREIEARGRPVVARSTAAGLEARGARLGYEIATRRILLDGELPVSLVARDIDMEARSIDYVPGPPGDPGSLMAVGPGWLTSKSAGGPPATVRYRKWLRVRPHGDGHVASISGDAEVAVESQGRLAASEIHCWLELQKGAAASPKAGPAAAPNLSGVRPTRMLANGAVQIEADQLAARVDRMEVWFRHPPPAEPASVPAAPVATAAPGAPRTASPPKPPVAATQTSESEQAAARGRLLASGSLLRGLVVMAPRGQQVEELSLEGQVHLVEEPLAPPAARVDPAEKPLEIRGDQLQLSRPMRFDARAVVAGRPATISGRGADLEGPLVEFDRGRNRMVVDGAGRLQIPVQPGTVGLDAVAMSTAPQARKPDPQAAEPATERLAVAWRGRMDFDGLTARFIDQVVAVSGGASLNAGALDVVFDRRFQFGGGADPRAVGRPEVARIACGSGVRLESTSTTEDGSRSVEKLSLLDMVVDRGTGDFSGNGPGRLSSTRFGQPPGMMSPGGLPGAGGPAPQPAMRQAAHVAPQPAARPDELTYLGVTFQRGMRGNLNRRVMEFQQRVEAIWGPVPSWESTLDLHAPGGLPARAVSVSSDTLAVGQSPVAVGRRNAIELQAGGNVLVEGDTFTARSGRLSWSEAKDLLVFEGDGRSGAQLYRQMQVGAPTSTASAGRILYWRALNRVQTDDVRYFDFDQIGGPSAGLAIPGLGGSPRK